MMLLSTNALHPLSDSTDEESFAAILRRVILEELRRNPNHSAESLLMSLPSVYPARVAKIVDGLRSMCPPAERVAKQFSSRPVEPQKETTKLDHILPDPHPLDSEWRFTDSCCKRLATKIQTLTLPSDLVIGLGTPSLLTCPLKRKFCLFDNNPAISDAFPDLEASGQLFALDLLSEKIPERAARLVVLDPPWYVDEIFAFLWCARKVCAPGGKILLAFPQVGTRPGMRKELMEVLAWCADLNFEVLDYIDNFVKYQSPSFEQTALAAEGVQNYPANWRRADLIVLKAGLTRPNVARPKTSKTRDWREVRLGTTRLRVAVESKGRFEDPRLISLTEKDRPVTVSRREPVKQLAKVWTSLNQIFDCRGPEIYHQIAEAISHNESPQLRLKRFLRRSLSLMEQNQVEEAASQTRRLIRDTIFRENIRGEGGEVKRTMAKLSFDVNAILRKAGLEKHNGSRIHLAVFVEPFLSYVLDGTKTVESRFSITRRAPFRQVESGDIVLMKRSGGPIVGSFEVEHVWSYILNPGSWSELKNVFTEALRAQDPDFWTSRSAARFATLMRVKNVKPLAPFSIEKRDMRGWLVLKEPDNQQGLPLCT